MPNPFDISDTLALPADQTTTLQQNIPFAQNIQAGVNAQTANNPSDPFLDLRTQAINEYKSKGLAPPQALLSGDGSVASMAAALHQINGMPLPWWVGDMSKNPDRDQIIQSDALLKAAGGKGLADLYQEMQAKRASLAADAQQVASQDTSIAGQATRMAGGMGGFFHDPLNVITTVPFLEVGGFGKSVATRIATEAGIFGGIGAANAAGLANPTHAAFGEQPESVSDAFLSGALGGALVRGTVEGLGAAIKLWRAPKTVLPDITEELHTALEANPENPQARAAQYALSLRDAFDQTNPYPFGAAGDKQFIADSTEVLKNIQGRTDTALWQTMPQEPFEIDMNGLNRTPDELAAMKADPELMGRLKQAQVELQQLHIEKQLLLEHVARENRLPYLSEVMEVLRDPNSEAVAKAQETLNGSLYSDGIPARDARGGAVSVLQRIQAAKEIIDTQLKKYFGENRGPFATRTEVVHNGIDVPQIPGQHTPNITKEVPLRETSAPTVFGEKLGQNRSRLTQEEAAQLFNEHQTGLTGKLTKAFDDYQHAAKNFIPSLENTGRRLGEALKLQDAAGRVVDPSAAVDRVPENIKNLHTQAGVNVDNLFTKPEAAEIKPGDIPTDKPPLQKPVVNVTEGKITFDNGKSLPADMTYTTTDRFGNEVTKTVADFVKEFADDKDMLDAMGSCAL